MGTDSVSLGKHRSGHGQKWDATWQAAYHPGMNRISVDHTLELRAWLASGRAVELRDKAGLSRAAVARDLGIAESAVWRWEHGRRNPRGLHAAAYYRLLARLAPREGARWPAA